MPKIELCELYCYYKKGKEENLIISNMSESFPSGKISVIMGPSGCGKTTLLKSILGLLEYDGDILLDGRDVYNLPIAKRNMAYINQDVGVYPHLTVFENIAFPLRIRKLERDEIYGRVRKIAERFGIAHCLNVKPKYLSLGQQQRVLLARELVGDPSLVLMDEPVSHLDCFSKEATLSFLKELNGEMGFTILYVTHSYKEAIALGDRIYVMEEGRFVLKGPPERILSSSDPFVSKMRYAE